MSTEEIVIQDHERPALKGGGNPRNAPKFGCIIFCLIGAFFIGIVINIVVNSSRHAKALIPLTSNEGVEVQSESGTDEEVTELKARVKTFIDAVNNSAKPKAELQMTTRDLNILISNHAYLLDIRGVYFFEEFVEPDLMRAKTSRAMRKMLPWHERRYMNGEIEFRVESAPGKVFVRVNRMQLDKGELPANMLAAWQVQDELKLYKNDDAFAGVIAKIQSAVIKDGVLVISTVPAPEEAEGPAGEPAKTTGEAAE